MTRRIRWIVVSFRRVKGRFEPLDQVRMDREEAAIERAELLAGRSAGAVVFEVHVDDETREAHDPRVIAVRGSMPPELAEQMAEAA